jgi:uncharacterized protein (TIGR02271 family)
MENEKNILPDAQFSQQEDDNLKETVVIPVINENVSINKKIVETRKIRVSKKVNEADEFVNTPLIHEEVDVQRIPINKYVDDMPEPVRYEGDTMIIPVLKEVSVVRIMLVEEIHVTKKRVQTQDAQNISLRKEEIIIENLLPGQSGNQQ